jgi:hypothetical protein
MLAAVSFEVHRSFYSTIMTKFVDYLWERKVIFIIIVAAVFFALHGVIEAVNSF